MIYFSGVVNKAAPAIGLMLTPYIGNVVDLTSRQWAADSGAFNREPDFERYLEWLDDRPRDTCLFAAALDCPPWRGSHMDSLAASRASAPAIRALGFRVALVLQDGMTVEMIPWDEFDAVFVGGSTEWKLNGAWPLVEEAKRRGMWAHMGRVNSLRRMRIAAAMGCDSTDGTLLAYGPDIHGPKLEGWQRSVRAEPALPLSSTHRR